MLPKIDEALVVVMRGREAGALGHWAKPGGDEQALLRFAQLAANSPSERFVQRGDRDFFALPLTSKGDDGGEFVVVATTHLAEAKARDSLAKFLKAGAVWYQLLKHNAPAAVGAAQPPIAELIAEFIAIDRLPSAHTVLVSRLAKQVRCDQIALVYQPNRSAKARVLAISDAAKVWQQADAVQGLLLQAKPALAQAFDAQSPVADGSDRDVRSPSTDDDALAVLDHWGGCWYLLADDGQAAPAEIASLWQALVPVLALRQQASLSPLAKARGLINRHKPRYWLWLSLAAVIVLLALPMDYRISAQAELEGITQRAVVAPADGFVRSSFFRAGDIVNKGDLIAQLDDDELKLEQKQIGNEIAELDRQYRQALVDSDLSQSRVVKSQLAQSQAQLDIIEHRLGRTQLIAPFAGVIIQGDLTRSEGAPVDKGQVLFEIAPAGEFRLVLLVDERNMAHLTPGSAGDLYLNTQPGQGLGFVVERIAHVAEAHAGGPQKYRVEATLSDLPAELVLQPGMQGVAKVDAGRRNLIWVLLHRPWHWLVLKWWAITP